MDWFGCTEKLGTAIVISPLMIDAFHGYEEAVFVSQLKFWMRICEDQQEYWVYKSSVELEQVFRLSQKQQIRVREALKSQGVLEERYDRAEHRFYFRLKRDAYNTAMTTAEKKLEQVVPVPQTVEYQYPKRAGTSTQNGVVPVPQTGKSYKEAEITTETTHRLRDDLPRGDSLQPNFSTFAKRWLHLVGTHPSRNKSTVALHAKAARALGDEKVNDAIAPWKVGKYAEWLKGGYAVRQFLETDVYEMVEVSGMPPPVEPEDDMPTVASIRRDVERRRHEKA